MSPKERILAILNGRQLDRMPVDLWYTPEIGTQLKERYHANNDYGLYEAMNLDKIVWISPEYDPLKENEKSTSGMGAQSIDRTIWGVPLKKIQTGNTVRHELGEPPLSIYYDPIALEDYPYWPDPDHFNYEVSKKNAKKASPKYATIGLWASFYKTYCQLRGLEQALFDVMTNSKLVEAILDRIEDSQTKILEKFLHILGDDLDMILISDNMATQKNLGIPAVIWKQFFRARIKRLCGLIHSYNKKVFYHSDSIGDDLIPDLLDCGIDILNPIRHPCSDMDMTILKKKYGASVTFHGGIDNQSVLALGSPDQVRAETVRCLNTLGADGKGYIVCTCHKIQPGTPIENVTTMVETVLQKNGHNKLYPVTNNKSN